MHTKLSSSLLGLSLTLRGGRALTVMSEHFGEEHESIANILKSMAVCYEKQGFHELALDTCILAIQIGRVVEEAGGEVDTESVEEE